MRASPKKIAHAVVALSNVILTFRTVELLRRVLIFTTLGVSLTFPVVARAQCQTAQCIAAVELTQSPLVVPAAPVPALPNTYLTIGFGLVLGGVGLVLSRQAWRRARYQEA